MDLAYLILPFLTWFVTGVIKFIINSVKTSKLAFEQVGYGGMPSNHSAIVSALVMMVALREGFTHPAFGVALTLAFIVIMDAGGLRRQIASHAVLLNKLKQQHQGNELRESFGHDKLEIIAGIVVGIVIAWLVNWLSGYF